MYTYMLYETFDRERAYVCQGPTTILQGPYSISDVHPRELRLDSSMTRIKIRIFNGWKKFGAKNIAKNWQYLF